MSKRNPNNYTVPIIIIGLLFFVLGFSIGINTYLIPFLRGVFNLSTAASYLVMTATFSAYVIFGIPSGYIIQRIGYKKGIVLAFMILALGMFLFVPSANKSSFLLFLLALFIGGTGQTLLQTSINPYITILGPGESAARRICIMGIANKVAFSLGPIILSLFMDLQQIHVEDIVKPFIIIAAVLLAVAGLSLLAPLPEIEAKTERDSQEPGSVSRQDSIFHFPHLFLGVIALFLSIGVEGLALGTILDFARSLHLPGLQLFGINVLAPEIFVSYTTFSMITGYLIGIILIPNVISQQQALKYSGLFGVVVTILILVIPAKSAVFLVALLGVANAVQWPAIWPLSLAGLGKLTKKGSSLLVVGITGGAIIPLIFGWMVDLLSYQLAYWIAIPGYLYILYFATTGHQMRKHGIKR